jgi:hypothetical protein
MPFSLYGKTISGIAVILYVVDIQYYTIIEDSWGIGMVNCIKQKIDSINFIISSMNILFKFR